MSRKHHKLKQPRNEIVPFLPVQRSSKASRIMDWLITGSEDGKRAVQELFPLPLDEKDNVLNTTN